MNELYRIEESNFKDIRFIQFLWEFKRFLSRFNVKNEDINIITEKPSYQKKLLDLWALFDDVSKDIAPFKRSEIKKDDLEKDLELLLEEFEDHDKEIIDKLRIKILTKPWINQLDEINEFRITFETTLLEICVFFLKEDNFIEISIS